MQKLSFFRKKLNFFAHEKDEGTAHSGINIIYGGTAALSCMDDVEEKLETQLEKTVKREDFCAFLELLVEDCNENLEFWNNQDIFAFLAALKSYAQQGAAEPAGADPERASWRAFADMLFVARAYDLD